MATAVGLNMKITADTAGIGRGMNRTEKALAGLKRSTDQAASALRGLVAIEVGKILANSFSNVASAALGMANRLRVAIDETAKLARQTGIAVEQLQVFQLAAKMSGVDNLVEPIRKLGIEIGNAANTGNIQKFQRLGLNFAELAALAPEDQFKAVASAIAAMPTPAERAAAAVAIFGEQGVKLLPLFESNLAAIEERMKRLGAVLSEEQTGAIEEMNDALTLVQAAFDGIIGQVTANLAPIVTAMAEDLLTFIESYGGLGEGTGGTALADSITEALLNGAEYLAGIFDYFMDQIGSFAEIMEGVGAVFEFAANAFTAVVETLRTVFNFFEMIGNAIAAQWGMLFQAIGSWVSSDLEEIGRNLVSSSSTAFMQNASEAGDAAAHAFNAALGDRNYGRGAEGNGTGIAGAAVREARARFEGRNSPESDAEREAKRAERASQRQAAVDAANAAKEQKRIEDEQKRAAEEQKKIEERRLQDIGRLNEQYAEKSTEIEASRLDTLSRANQNALEASDIRSGGISQFLALATGREDPAVAEARAQRQELEKIAAEIRKLGGTVELVGAA